LFSSFDCDPVGVLHETDETTHNSAKTDDKSLFIVIISNQNFPFNIRLFKFRPNPKMLVDKDDEQKMLYVKADDQSILPHGEEDIDDIQYLCH
jgi:hypothetical protein